MLEFGALVSREKKICLLILAYCLSFNWSKAQEAQTLKEYMAMAKATNPTIQRLRQEAVLVDQSPPLFAPSLSIVARYSVARGGREVELPYGQLFNPAYQNLNLVNDNLNTNFPDFPLINTHPSLSDDSFLFLREQEHETKLQLLLPVFDPAILIRSSSQQQLKSLEGLKIAQEEYLLDRKIEMAYLEILKAKEVLEIYKNNKGLLESAYKNSLVVFEKSIIAKEELAFVKEQLLRLVEQWEDTQRQLFLAEAYFNTLVGREIGDSVNIKTPPSYQAIPWTIPLENTIELAYENRQELKAFEYRHLLADDQIKQERNRQLPSLNLVVDYGFQGEQYGFTSNDDFFQGSVLMNWPLYDRKHRLDVEKRKIEKDILSLNKEEVLRVIKLEVVDAFLKTVSAWKKIELLKVEKETKQTTHELIKERYKYGNTSLSEYTQSIIQLTNLVHQQLIVEYDYQTQLVKLKMACGL